MAYQGDNIAFGETFTNGNNLISTCMYKSRGWLERCREGVDHIGTGSRPVRIEEGLVEKVLECGEPKKVGCVRGG